jgi:hypothetical protein
VTVNPEGEAADALRSWWDSEGSSACITPLGQGAAAGAAGGAAAGRSNKLQFLSDVVVSASHDSTQDLLSPAQLQSCRTMRLDLATRMLLPWTKSFTSSDLRKAVDAFAQDVLCVPALVLSRMIVAVATVACGGAHLHTNLCHHGSIQPAR